MKLYSNGAIHQSQILKRQISNTALHLPVLVPRGMVHLSRRVLLFPDGNKQRDTISAFLECVDLASPNADPHMVVCGAFVLGVHRPNSDDSKPSQVAVHRFTSPDIDWGFSILFQWSEIPPKLLQNDSIHFFCVLKIYKDVTGSLWHNFYKYICLI